MKIFGLRRSALIEMVIFFTALFLLDIFIFQNDRFFTINPHPYWVIVLLMSIQYGTSEGLMVAIVSSLFLLVGNFPEQNINQDIHTYYFSLSVNFR